MDPLTEQQKRLADEAVGRARKIADRYSRVFPEHAEALRSSAAWGAIRAASSFKHEGVWDRWSALCIRSEIRHCLARERTRSQDIDVDDLPEEMIESGRASQPGETVEWALSILPKGQREICSLVYVDNMTPSDAGVALGYTERYGRLLHAQAISYLRDRIAG